MFLNPEKNLMQVSIGSGATVADFGCGNGVYAKVLSRLVGENGSVICIDLNSDLVHKLLREAKLEGITNIIGTVGDIEKDGGSKLQNESVDLVLIANTFFAVDDKNSCLKEAFRILRPKGRVLLVEWTDSLAGFGPHRKHIISKEDSLKIFKENSFQFEKEIEAGDHHYGLVFRK